VTRRVDEEITDNWSGLNPRNGLTQYTFGRGSRDDPTIDNEGTRLLGADDEAARSYDDKGRHAGSFACLAANSEAWSLSSDSTPHNVSFM